MVKTFQPPAKPQSIVVQWGALPQLPLDVDAVMYPRVSTPGQKGNVSAELQLKEDGDLWNLALRCGWKLEQIRFPKDDMALSGQLRMEDRPAFKQMLYWIITGEVKAVISVQVDRLFRDKWGTEYSKFMEICEKHGVIVVTPDMVYDFRDAYCIKVFRDRCIQAWEYLEYQVYKRMLGAKDYLGETGRWAGGNLPPGYIVDRNSKSDTYRKYLRYAAWGDVVLAMFERYRELNDNLMALHREYDAKPFMFPDFESWVDPEIVSKCRLRKVPGGYTMSLSAMQRMLCNPVYIGWWIYHDVILVDEHGLPKINHEPIIPLGRQEELFWHAFRQRSMYNIDGTKNEQAVGQQTRRYTQEHSPTPPAILKLVVKSADKTYSVHVVPHVKENGRRRYSYAFRKKMYGYSGGAKYMLSTKTVDAVYWQQLMHHLWETEDFDDFATAEEETTKNTEAEKAEITEQIAACDRKLTKLLKRLALLEEEDQTDKDKEAPTREDMPTDEDDLAAKAADEALKKMIAFLKDECTKFSFEKLRQQARLEKLEKSQVTPYAQQMITYKELLREVGDRAREIYTIEELYDVVETFSTMVTLDTISPRVWKLSITWRDPAWGRDEIVCFREVGNPSVRWSKEEDALLSQSYVHSPRNELLTLFPNRSWHGIQSRGSQLGVRRVRDDSSDLFPPDISLQDWQAMQEYGLTKGVKCVRSY